MFNNDIRSYILEWNIRHPVDRWWREKYNIPFNSEAHRVSNFIDMAVQFEEDKMYSELRTQTNEVEDKYIPGQGNFLKQKELTQTEIDDAFDNMNLDDF